MCKKRCYIKGTNILEDCLACGNSMSEEGENEGTDKLFCTVKDDYVNENNWCENYN